MFFKIFLNCDYFSFERILKPLIFTAQPCYFTRQLKSFRDIEHRTVKIDCQVDIEEAIVNWYFDGIEILKGYPDWFDKIREEEDGRERFLIIEDVPREAQGMFECKTNSDETQMKLRVAPVNEFLKPLEDQTCSEKEQVTFECQMLDEEGDAEWRVAGNVVSEDDRVQIKKLDKGVHRLIILRARITDTGDVSCTCVGQNETTAKLVVNKAEVVVEAKDQDADDGKAKAKAKGNEFCFVFSIPVEEPRWVLFLLSLDYTVVCPKLVTLCPNDTVYYCCDPCSSSSPNSWRPPDRQDQGQSGSRGAQRPVRGQPGRGGLHLQVQEASPKSLWEIHTCILI